MNPKKARSLRIVLMLIAFITFSSGLSLSLIAEQNAARDTKKIKVQIVEKNVSYNPDEVSYRSSGYHVEFTYKIKNGTKVDWSYLKIQTSVYDKQGEYLGTITVELGSADWKLKARDTVTHKPSFTGDPSDPFFKALYETPLSELKFESEITNGTYLD